MKMNGCSKMSIKMTISALLPSDFSFDIILGVITILWNMLFVPLFCFYMKPLISSTMTWIVANPRTLSIWELNDLDLLSTFVGPGVNQQCLIP